MVQSHLLICWNCRCINC